MKQKRLAVVWLKNNARILTNPRHIEALREKRNVTVDAYLGNVTGLEPHYWANRDGLICPMGHRERLDREDAIQREGIETCVKDALRTSRIHRLIHHPVMPSALGSVIVLMVLLFQAAIN